MKILLYLEKNSAPFGKTENKHEAKVGCDRKPQAFQFLGNSKSHTCDYKYLAKDISHFYKFHIFSRNVNFFQIKIISFCLKFQCF